ncbi:TrmB family transcriptional regulator [Candidatus Cloacimonadota bacterium]
MIIKKLTDLVMNERQAKVYLSIIKNNASTASELNRLSGVPLNKMYETLKHLNSNGFCVKRNGSKKITYVATDPIIAFQAILQEKKDRLEQTKDLQMELLKIYKSAPIQNGFSEYIEVVHGNLNIHTKYIELVKGSKKSIMSISCPPFARSTKKQAIEQEVAFQEFYDKGGRDKSIIEVNDQSSTFVYYSVRESLLNPDKYEARITEKSPIKLYIFDNKILMTFNESFHIKEGELSASIINQSSTVETYIQMFHFLWDQAESVDDWLKNNRKLYEQKLLEYDQSK